MSSNLIQYNKTAKSSEELHAHLLSKGLISLDYNEEINKIERIGYHRLLIYMRPLQNSEKNFFDGTTFENILNLYDFDRKLRLLCIDAIEKIEVSIRSAVVNTISITNGPHFYLYGSNFKTESGYKEFLRKALDTKYLSIKHYHEKYNDPTLAPIWSIVEGITFGTLSRLVSNLNDDNRRAVALNLGIHHRVLVSWVRSLNMVRNMCAHHNRLWNAKMEIDKPKRANYIADEFPQDASTFFARAVVINAFMLKIDSDYNWSSKLKNLINDHRFVNPPAMGFIPGWDERAFWQ